ncbi:MAG TPA: hypothetical protein VLA51_04680 [Paracoccaceae bacterium]|nr:hypothetical protein [Paracoccaceae bacterium]
MTETLKVLPYFLLTHGKKPSGATVANHPAARRQFENIRAFLAEDVQAQNLEVATRSHDYARGDFTYLDLRGLHSAFRYLATGKAKLIIIDDLTRLFKNADPHERIALFEALRLARNCLYGIRQKALLNSFTKSDAAVRRLLFHHDNKRWSYEKQTRRYDSAEDRKLQTSKASAASVAARRALSGRAYEVLLALKKEIEAERGTEISNAELARSANEKNLRNARGNPWTRQTVKRALDRNPTSAETRSPRYSSPGSP